MKEFMNENFLLNSELAIELYHNHAKKMPIFDFHNHLSAKEIYEDIHYDNISDLWLSGDHYKWRAMRAMGIDEKWITGKSDPYTKYTYYVKTVQNAIGNPLYHWTHLELQRYFNITLPLSPKTQDEIWKQTNKILQDEKMTTRHLLKMQNVVALCTTDDPIDDLHYHQLLKEEKCFKVLPTFRPDQVVNIEKESFTPYIHQLENTVGYSIHSLHQLEQALTERIEYFKEVGCLVSDHSLETAFFSKTTKENVEIIFQKRLSGENLSEQEIAAYKGHLLTFLGKQYHDHQIVMQFHIGALRNNAQRRFDTLGADTGFDSMNDFNYAASLSHLLNEMDKTNQLPRIVLYCLNSKDNEMLISMAGNFQDDSCIGKVQFGVPWWFNDHKYGMERQLEQLAAIGLLAPFIGMLTDSRSFLSFPRHEYFRRILCNKIASWVENGEYPCDKEYLGELIENICFNNAKNYFRLK